MSSKAVAKKPEAEIAMSEDAAIFSMIERVARDNQVDIGRLRELMAMQKDAAASRARTAFLAGFAKLQADLPAVERKGTGHNQKRYARFEDLITAIKKPLAEHGFSLSFRIQQEPSSIKVTGVLGHENGHVEETCIVLPADKTGNKNDVQAWGSSVSYGKRYVALTLLGIATEDEDDDGKKASAGDKIKAEDVEKVRSLIMETNSDIAKFYVTFDIECLEDLPAAKLQTAIDLLELKKKRKGA